MTSLVWILWSPTLTRSALSLQVKQACKLALQPRSNFAEINSLLWDRYVATHTNAQISAGPVWDSAPVSWLWLFARGGTARLVKRPTEKPGATLTRVRVPGAARDFSSRVNLQRRFSYYGVLSASASVGPLKNPKHWIDRLPLHCLDTKILHILVGIGSAALVAAAPYPGKATWIPVRDNEELQRG